ncbi:RteC domain-containing protein [Dysgonomonas massiliensis]|uniref:RteC domain-containing protein n=1 Tax=Dysgonomonas massiliensis TaxID=2040292 RepID=UPI000C76DA8A|nr:RteC domain-containing protein [Dysgonomonas massiliensis]
MQNWELTEKRIYQLLKHPYQIDKSIVENMTSAYLEFVEELFTYLNEGRDNKSIIRKLNTTHIEFATIKAFEQSHPTENNKLKVVFLDKLITLVEKELELLYRQMEYPKFFINIESEWKSPICINSEEIKLIDIMELACGFFYLANGVIRIDNRELHLIDVTRLFEKIFNVNLGDIYKKEEAVIKRRPTKITEFLDRLKAVIIQKSIEQGYNLQSDFEK